MNDTNGHAGEQGALLTYLQPFYNLRSDALQGHEALVRGRSADGGVESPARALANAEAAGAMHELDRQTLDDALAFQAEFRQAHPQHHAIVSVNLSYDTVSSPLLATEIGTALRRHRVGGDRLLIDITADIFRRLLDSDRAAFSRLSDVQREEVTLCLDGFTAADLDLLPAAAEVPVDIIKLHPALVSGDKREDLQAIATAVQEIGLPVVAAGVESAAELDLVRELGFEWAQGFHLGEPVEVRDALTAPLTLPSR